MLSSLEDTCVVIVDAFGGAALFGEQTDRYCVAFNATVLIGVMLTPTF